MSLTRITLVEKVRALKKIMNDGSWYVSEKVRVMDPTGNIKFDISPALSLLYRNGYLDRKSSKRIYFNPRRTGGRRYHGHYAYKFKDEYLKENHEQLKIEYG